ncbi:hypothetical protein BCR33DRAFT_718648 [Rhizoclosmatium globosum]|uniref:Glycosyltransferase family 17 protein n=1 Tax=Rhizoclosmatium globosum TaxID=329046 RepID=A0A1Y2C4R9_9FUNG|nr:hypothetical protein BCR33DRAFT_718648 [Rhizoclosmatium globosum]|eukprot:ORY42018.1 hypothetical protein BCR33DRAFT_718648 [Rhizoclosmatium globosum]
MQRFGWYMYRENELTEDLVRESVHYGACLDCEVFNPVMYQPDGMNPARYSHMLQRRNAFAGFKDLRERDRVLLSKRFTCEELGGTNKNMANAPSVPRVLDYILYNGEQDILEVRLNTLGPYVDKFLIAETNWTFTGKPKEFKLPLLENHPAFTKYWDKIVHIQVDPPSSDVNDNWEREHYNRNRGLQLGLQMIPPKNEDFLFMSDLDEIWRPSLAQTLKTCTDFEHTIFTLHHDFFYYGYEFKRKEAWIIARMLRWTEAANASDPTLANTIRGTYEYQRVTKAGWHCSWCFSNISQVLSKVQAYSHQEHNQPEFLTRENILNGVRYGFDLFGRTGDQFWVIEENLDVPDYVALNREKYEYMLHRRNVWSGFIDVKEEISTILK